MPLARTGTVQTFVINHAMPAPFVAPLPLVCVDLDDGSRVMFQGEGTGADLAIGSPVDLVLRRYAIERGVPVYGWKVRSTMIGNPWDRVAVVGAGLIKMGELFDQGFEDMAKGAFDAAVASVDHGIDRSAFDGVFLATQRGTLWGQEGIAGNTVPSAIGLAGIACTRIENACPSGSDAFRVACMAVASGVHDVVLVIGVEKMRDKSAEEGLLARAASGHPILTRGESAPVLFAPFATRHMHEFGTTREHLAAVAVKNHHNGKLDPYAHFRNEVTVEDVLASPPVCHPLHLLDCCPQTDGAAAMVICSPERAAEFTDKPIMVAGFGVATDHPYLHEKSYVRRPARPRCSPRSGPTRWPASDRPTSTAPRCTTASPSPRSSTSRTSASATRARAARSPPTATPRSTARIPVNTSGGLLAKGHPIGATGVAQLTELWWQLREDAGDRQVALRTGYALQHNVGGRGSGVSVVNILHRPG